MSVKDVTFSASSDQLDQLRYALVDRIHELERLLLEGDSDEILRMALERTRELRQVLEDAVR